MLILELLHHQAGGHCDPNIKAGGGQEGSGGGSVSLSQQAAKEVSTVVIFTYRNRPVVVLVPVRKIVGRSGFAIEQAQNCWAGFLLPRKGS